MEILEIIKAIRRNMVETGSLMCVGCGREHNCSIHGCAIMREAADALEKQLTCRPTPENKPLTLDELRQMDGEPVWTVTIGCDNVFGCELVGEISVGPENREVISMCNLLDGTYDVFADLYGKTWLAYARNPEQEEK